MSPGDRGQVAAIHVCERRKSHAFGHITLDDAPHETSVRCCDKPLLGRNVIIGSKNNKMPMAECKEGPQKAIDKEEQSGCSPCDEETIGLAYI
jgi:hypothetical protein